MATINPVVTRGSINGYVIMAQDISEMKQYQLEVLQSSKLASFGGLAAGVGHEINNPLAIISGNVHRLKKFCHSMQVHEEKVLERFQKILNSVERIQNMVNALRTFAVADTDHYAPIDIAESIESIVNVVKTVYGSDGVQIDLIRPKGSVLVQGSIGRVQQIVMNLVSNAKRAVKEVPTPKIEVRVTTTNGHAMIAVKDNGHGIPMEIREKIFDPFFSNRQLGDRCGMGLTLTLSMVKELGGTIEVQSLEGLGAHFIVKLPIAKPVEVAKPDPLKESSALINEFSKLRVLLVDDEIEVRDLLRETLADFSVSKIRTASNAKEALALLRRETFDLVFTDIRMPNMGGTELILEIRDIDTEKEPIIYVLTGGVASALDKGQRKILSELIDGYILKPYTEQQIEMALRAAIYSKRK